MSVAKEIKDYLEASSLGGSFFVSRTPSVSLSSDDQWAIVEAGGSISGGNILQWKRTHNLLAVYRNSKGEELYNKDDALLALLNMQCLALPSYRVLRCEVSPLQELDLAAKDVHVGQWAITLDIVTKDEES